MADLAPDPFANVVPIKPGHQPPGDLVTMRLSDLRRAQDAAIRAAVKARYPEQIRIIAGLREQTAAQQTHIQELQARLKHWQAMATGLGVILALAAFWAATLP
jgi:hypothetical protein